MGKTTLRQKAESLKRQSYALYLAGKDPRVPWYAKALAACVIAYLLSPIDLIPDFIPVIGYLDDLILIPAGIALTVKMIPADVWEECRYKAGQIDYTAKSKWIAAGVIAVAWIIVAIFLFKAAGILF